MAWAAARQQGGGCNALLGAVGFRVALIHGSPPCNEKWDNKWKSMVYGYMDADSCRKRYRKYVKRQKRAADKRDLLQWRSLEMDADEYREGQERRRQRVESAQKPHTATASGWSRRVEIEWRTFERKHRGRHGYQEKYQTRTRSENAADTEDPTYGATEGAEAYGESESARYRRHFWSNTWRGFDGGAHWNFGENLGGETPYQARACNHTIGSPADRLTLGLSPAGSLSLEELKLAFRQSALLWHPDRHDGDQKQAAEAKFKRMGDAYRTLCELL